MLVHIKKLVRKIAKRKCALGAFDTFNFEITLGIIQGAKRAESPIVIQVTPKTLKYTGIETITQIIQSIADDQGKDIPVALHLDHGRTFSDVVKCVQTGFSSVMIDVSDHPFDENVSLTKKVAQYAHQRNVWVQGELGLVVKGKEGYQKLIEKPEEFLTDPDQAQEFVKKTKIDALAVAIGNVHGHYKMEHGVPRLFLSRLKEIERKVDIPLVLHGASGISPARIKQAVNFGIRIINIDTEIRMAFKRALITSLKTQKREIDPRKILLPVIKEVSRVVEKKIKIFNQGKVI